MGFQAQPSCFLAILRYFRSLQSQERCYNLSHGKGKKEEEDLQLIIARNPCFERKKVVPVFVAYNTKID